MRLAPPIHRGAGGVETILERSELVVVHNQSKRPSPMALMQERLHGEGHDYAAGSPHIKHLQLREHVVDVFQGLIREVMERKGSCSVLEIGAGHGTFTDHAAAVGARVLVTEMSRPSVQLLTNRFSHNPNVTIISDSDGFQVFRESQRFDVIACISVLHHVPDYLTLVERFADELMEPAGHLFSYQDPLWYPRQPHWTRGIDRAAYLAWRLGRGELSKGLKTQMRRMRGALDESNPSDMVEYHVVRQGVNEEALFRALEQRFESVDLDTYWSTQSPMLQSVGQRLRLKSTFGVTAMGRL